MPGNISRKRLPCADAQLSVAKRAEMAESGCALHHTLPQILCPLAVDAARLPPGSLSAFC